MTEKTFNLPDVGEGLTEADIVQWKVQPGDTVAVNDVIVEIETAKSLVELPSPYAGTVSALMVAEGETVDVGTPIISVAVGGGPRAEATTPAPQAAPPQAAAPTGSAGAEEAPASSLTGTGPKPDAVRRRLRRRPVPVEAAASPAAVPATPAEQLAVKPAAVPAPAKEPAPQPASAAAAAVQERVNRLIQRVLAKPPVRKAAKDLGINLADVPATGAGGEVTKQDLLSYQAQREAERASAGRFWAADTGGQDARIERIPVKGVRRATAKAMVESAFSAPHVSIFVDVDASRTMEFVKRLKASKDFEGIRVSPLLVLAKAVIWAAARNPSVNATWAGDEILVKHFMNLGIAAATPRGLMVPNIKDAQKLSLKELAVALNDLAATAREGRTPPADMQGGTLTVTNIGSLGIEVADVPATGSGGEVTKQDLLSYQAQREAERASAGRFWAADTGGQDARIERIPVKGVRRATAKAMVESAFSAPHVSIFVDVDASRTMEFVKRLKASKDFEGIRVSPLLVLAKAVIWAAARNPSVNATWAGDEILVKHFMNLGIAAATPRGLMVPNIKDAQKLSLKELAVALNDLAATAREGRTPPADMQGGTLTVTNIGSLGIDTGTPIINPGEVAIVAFGTIKQKPWVVDGEVVPRWITTLGGSFDHRVVDGDLSARFMADVASILEEPALLLD